MPHYVLYFGDMIIWHFWWISLVEFTQPLLFFSQCHLFIIGCCRLVSVRRWYHTRGQVETFTTRSLSTLITRNTRSKCYWHAISGHRKMMHLWILPYFRRGGQHIAHYLINYILYVMFYIKKFCLRFILFYIVYIYSRWDTV